MRILVVDDSATIRRIIARELIGGGYEVHEAVDGVDALEWILSNPPPDLMTLDVEMPRLDGFATLRALQTDPYASRFVLPGGDKVPVVFVTGNDTIDDRRNGFSLGAADFVTKPFLKGDILSAVDKVLRPNKRLEGLKALVADDSSTARHIVADSLTREGIDVIAVADGKEAFETICKHMNEIDVVITDLMMPGMDGRELCRRIRQELNLQALPVIFLTAVPDHEKLLDVFKAGATDYLIKPFIKEELLARLTVHFDRTQISHRLHRAVGELRNLNEIKDSLITICSHDLRAPLNGILGFAELILDKPYLKDEDQESIRQIKMSGSFLLSLINDILDLSKIRSTGSDMPTESVPLYDLVGASVGAMQFLAESKNHTVALDNECDDTLVAINSTAMMRVMNNLLSNAIKYTPEKGSIDVAIRAKSADHISVAVTDTGIGIPDEKIPFLFDRFTKIACAGTAGEESTGLGLSIVKEIVDAHGGTVEVTSEVGRGTTFEIVLLRSFHSPHRDGGAQKAAIREDAPPRVEEAPQVEREPIQVAPCQVLLVEDNPVNIKLAQRFLERDGHTVTIAENGRLALHAAARHDFDIIFMDVEMPEMTGPEATRALRKAGVIETPIIALTAHVSKEAIDRCRSSGMNDYLSKPIAAEDFRSMIGKYSSRATGKILSPG